MSQQVKTNTILKCLSDLSTAADKIFEEKASEFLPTCVFEWVEIIKSKANSILEENDGTTEFAEIPSLVSVLKGGTGQRGARASTMLTEIQRLHLHPRREGDVVQTRKSRQSVKTPLRSKDSLKNETPKLKIPPTIIKKIGTVYVTQSEKSLPLAPIEKEISLTSMISTNGKGVASDTKTLKSSKRKSSSEIMPDITNKKTKLSNPRAPGRLKSIQNPRVEKEMPVLKAKDSSLNSTSIKSSVGAMGFSASKKEQVLHSKIETKQDKAVENRKNIRALRQQKLEQNKKIRDEKIEKTKQQRQKLETQKLTKLKSGAKEKTLTNTCKEPTPKLLHKKAAESETLGVIKVLKKNEKKSPLRKLEDQAKKNNTDSSALKNSQKNQKQMLNTTYTTTEGDQPYNNKQQKNLKEPYSTNSHAGAMKDISNDNKTQTKHTHTKGSTILKPLKDASESYAMTPARSSFVSYDISEIRSDSEDEEPESNSKPIPSWATGVRLRNALLKQHHHPIDTDKLFGNIIDLPDLSSIMGVKKKHYNKRTSSAIWSSFC